MTVQRLLEEKASDAMSVLLFVQSGDLIVDADYDLLTYPTLPRLLLYFKMPRSLFIALKERHDVVT